MVPDGAATRREVVVNASEARALAEKRLREDAEPHLPAILAAVEDAAKLGKSHIRITELAPTDKLVAIKFVLEEAGYQWSMSGWGGEFDPVVVQIAW